MNYQIVWLICFHLALSLSTIYCTVIFIYGLIFKMLAHTLIHIGILLVHSLVISQRLLHRYYIIPPGYHL